MSFALNGIVNISGGDYTSTGANIIDEASYGGNVIGSANTVTNSPYATILSNDCTITNSTLATILGGQSKTITSSPGNLILSSNDDNFSVTSSTNQGIHLYTGYVHNYGGDIKPTAQSPAGAYAHGIHSTAGVPTGTQDTNARPYDEGALMFDSTNKKLYIFKSGAWAEAIITAQPAETLAATLVAGNSTGANDIIVSASQQVKYNGGVRVGLGGNNAAAVASSSIFVGDGSTGSAPNFIGIGKGVSATVGNDHSVISGAFASSSGGFGQSLYGANTVGGAGADYAVALGLGCEANATNCLAAGHNTICNVPSQLKFGNDSTTHVYAPGFIKSDLQKSVAAGVISTDPTQAIGTLATATVAIQSVRYDWSTPMRSGNTILLTDQQQVFGVSITISGTLASGISDTVTIRLKWFDGTSIIELCAQDVFVGVLSNVFNCTLSTGAKTIAAAGQYIFTEITNNLNRTITVTKYRISVTRVT